MELEKWVICDYCKGDGWTTEHDTMASHSPEDGTCISCPIQAGCEKCKGTGKILKSEIIEPTIKEITSNNNYVGF